MDNDPEKLILAISFAHTIMLDINNLLNGDSFVFLFHFRIESLDRNH